MTNPLRVAQQMPVVSTEKKTEPNTDRPAPLTPKLAMYHQQVLQTKKSIYMDYPSHVHMETLAVCTAACNFCPYPTIERKGTRMDDELIDKIISDLKDIPSYVPFQISPFKVNEPFSDKRMLDILDKIDRELPQASITITSNASMLTLDKLKHLTQLNNLAYLWISFNDHRPEHYTKTMRLPWERTIQKLDMIHAGKIAAWFPIKVVLSRVGDGTSADQEFQAWVEDRYPLFESSVFQRGGWIGQVDAIEHLPPVPDVGCLRWFDVSITATGKVAHCCMDGQCEWPVGDVRTTHVLDVYNAPEFRQLRETKLTRKEASPCNTCTFL
ncbi:MAG: radical SAM/SPASM domain-containing protein [Cyanobacteria bacterium P01_H01_bin.74]